MKQRRKRKLGNRGVALMLVLSAIAMLTVAGVEFAYNTNVASHLASNERDRLQAYYLAKSAYSFMLLELKYDRVFQNVVQSQNLSQFLGPAAQLPLCQQFPLSTGLLRLVFLNAGEGEDVPEELKKTLSLAQEAGAEDFLAFEGDFEGECVDETTKINLNIFATFDPERSSESGLNEYYQQQQLLIRFLKQPQFEGLFGEDERLIDEAVRNIADWVDVNETIDGGLVGGSGAEMSLYESQGRGYKVKSAKMTTLEEVFFIEGVRDDWFQPLRKHFTIYGDGKVNPCSTDQGILEGLIRHYVESTPDLPPLRLEDPEVMERLLKAVSGACSSGGTGDQLITAVSTQLEQAIRVDEAPLDEGTTPQTTQQEGFRKYLTSERRFFTLNLTGQVADSTVRIKAVVDVQEADPKKWPLLYWKVY